MTSIQRDPSSAFVRSAAAIVSGVIVDIAGVAVLLRADDHRRAAGVARMAARWPDAASPAAIEVDVVGTPPSMPSHDPDESFDGTEVWQHGDEVLARLGDGGSLRADLEHLTIGGDPALPSLRWLFHLGITHALAARGRFVLHAAAVASGDGAWIVLGASGAGKSTLAYAAARRGDPVLSDDLVVVRGDDLSVTGIARAPSVPSELVADERRPTDWRGRVELDELALAEGWWPVRGVVVVQHGDTPNGDLSPMAATDAVEELVASFTAGANPAQLHRFFGVAASLARRGAYRLSHADDPSRRVDAAVASLERLG